MTRIRLSFETRNTRFKTEVHVILEQKGLLKTSTILVPTLRVMQLPYKIIVDSLKTCSGFIFFRRNWYFQFAWSTVWYINVDHSAPCSRAHGPCSLWLIDHAPKWVTPELKMPNSNVWKQHHVRRSYCCKTASVWRGLNISYCKDVLKSSFLHWATMTNLICIELCITSSLT